MTTGSSRYDRVFARRMISIPLVYLALPLWTVLSPIVVPVALLIDVIQGRWRVPTIRLWIFALVFTVHEWIGVAYATRLWVRGHFGQRLDLERHRCVQAWWATSLLGWARRLLHVELDLGDAASVPDGELIVLSRHASMIDALIPAVLFTGILDRPVHYVLKKELQWIPNIDIYGHRLGNHFVDRDGDRASEVAGIAELAQRALPDSALVIFPEGTYATAASKQRVARSLERRQQSHLASLNDELVRLLPPRAAGSLSLLDQRPTSPVMILGHVGLEGVAELRGLRRHLPARSPVVVRWWIQPRSSIPPDPPGRIEWLEDQWRTLDRWVVQELDS